MNMIPNPSTISIAIDLIKYTFVIFYLFRSLSGIEPL